MAFRRTTDPTFKADVEVNVAKADGTYEKNTFKAIFEHTTTEEQKQLRSLGNEELIKRKLKSWELVDEETKEHVPFTPENLEALLLIPPTPMQICIAFWETVNGARAKN